MVPAHAKEVANRRFDRRSSLIIPIESQDGIPPVTRWCHPDVLDTARSFDFDDGKDLARLDLYTGADLPALAKVPGGSGACSVSGFSACTFSTIEIFGTNGAGFCVGKLVKVAQTGTYTVKRLLCGYANDP